MVWVGTSMVSAAMMLPYVRGGLREEIAHSEVLPVLLQRGHRSLRIRAKRSRRLGTVRRIVLGIVSIGIYTVYSL
jgi:hypothetical protein